MLLEMVLLSSFFGAGEKRSRTEKQNEVLCLNFYNKVVQGYQKFSCDFQIVSDKYFFLRRLKSVHLSV